MTGSYEKGGSVFGPTRGTGYTAGAFAPRRPALSQSESVPDQLHFVIVWHIVPFWGRQNTVRSARATGKLFEQRVNDCSHLTSRGPFADSAASNVHRGKDFRQMCA